MCLGGGGGCYYEFVERGVNMDGEGTGGVGIARIREEVMRKLDIEG